MRLRDYQQKLVDEAREKILEYNSVFVQAPTGSGKSVIFTSLLNNVRKEKIAWVVVPRNELLRQSSNHLLKWDITHGMIKPGQQESKAFNIFVVSKDTLMRRLEKIKYPPDLIIIDEAHLFLDQQLKIRDTFPVAKILGFSATPERLDGRGLSEMYDSIVYGPSIPNLTERGFLVPIRYFSPPIEGLQALKKQGSDYKENELEDLLLRRHVYGQAIDHYRKYAHKKPAIVFCRSVKSAYETARQFRDAGYSAECIEGKMSTKKRESILNGFKNGLIDLITNCEIITYGLDIVCAEVGIMLRPTTSKALYMQMVGRILRPALGKKQAIIFDHVNNLFEHADPRYPDIPLFYVKDLQWNFTGTKKKKSLCLSCEFSSIESEYCDDRKKPVTKCKHYKKPEEIRAKLCEQCFLYYQGDVCPNCNFKKEKQQKTIEVIPEELKEIKPIALKDMPIEQCREYQDNINDLYYKYNSQDISLQSEAVKRMLEIQKSLGYNILWVYQKLNNSKRKTVNITLLQQIAREKKFKPGWSWHQRKRMETRR